MIDHNHFICHFIFGGHLLNIPRIIQNKKGHNFIQVVAFSTGREARTLWKILFLFLNLIIKLLRFRIQLFFYIICPDFVRPSTELTN